MQTMIARSFVTLFCNGNMLVPTVSIRSNTAKLENLFCYILANMYSLTTRIVWFVTNDNQTNKICLLIKKNTKQRNQILCRMVINITADMPTWIRLQVKQHQTWNTRINRNSDRVISTCKYRNNDVQSVRRRADHGHLSGELDNFILIISCKLIWGNHSSSQCFWFKGPWTTSSQCACIPVEANVKILLFYLLLSTYKLYLIPNL